MHLSTVAACASFVALVMATPDVRAQSSVLVGAGMTVPVGTVTDTGPFSNSNAGWQGTLGFRRSVGQSRLALGARVFYGRNGYEPPDEGGSRLHGVMALATWTLRESSPTPLLWVEAGLGGHDYTSDGGTPVTGDEDLGLVAGGIGAEVALGVFDVLILGKFAKAFTVFNDIRYFAVIAGLSITLD